MQGEGGGLGSGKNNVSNGMFVMIICIYNMCLISYLLDGDYEKCVVFNFGMMHKAVMFLWKKIKCPALMYFLFVCAGL